MNINTRRVWVLHTNNSSYWMDHAVETAIAELTGGKQVISNDLVDVFYASPEDAIQMATCILKKLNEQSEDVMSGPDFDVEFKKEEDEMQAARSIGKRPQNCERRYRWSGEPQFIEQKIEDEGDREVRFIRPCEIMLYCTKKVKKAIEIDGVTWTREVEETFESDWYPGEPEEITFVIYTHRIVEIS